jgi:hypothetical protein
MTTPVGVPLAEVTDPFALEVHRPVQPDQEQAGLPDLWVTFAVDDVDAIAARARELGGSVLAGPQNAPWVRFAILADPAGVLHRQPVRSGEPLDDPLSDIGDGINCQWRWSPWRRGTLS